MLNIPHYNFWGCQVVSTLEKWQTRQKQLEMLMLQTHSKKHFSSAQQCLDFLSPFWAKKIHLDATRINKNLSHWSENTAMLESHAFRVRFSHGRMLFDSRNVQKRATKSDTSGHCVRTLANCCRIHYVRTKRGLWKELVRVESSFCLSDMKWLEFWVVDLGWLMCSSWLCWIYLDLYRFFV